MQRTAGAADGVRVEPEQYLGSRGAHSAWTRREDVSDDVEGEAEPEGVQEQQEGNPLGAAQHHVEMVVDAPLHASQVIRLPAASSSASTRHSLSKVGPSFSTK